MLLGRQDIRDIKAMERGEPYIIGSVTNNRIIKMKKVVEFLLKLDRNRKNVVAKYEGDEKRIQ